MDQYNQLPKLYKELADWWPTLSSPDDYAEEAEFYRKAILSKCSFSPKSILELGSGGGNNASHLKKHFHMTLVDLSPDMLEVSRKLNPECEHIQGDMRSVRLEREYDAVFVHDAIVYMTSELDLRKAIETAYLHCKIGGVALFAPDHVREAFKPSTKHGGHDDGDRSLRYLEWTWDPDPTDTRYVSYMVYLLRKGLNQVECVVDKHECGLFGQDEWLRILEEVGFRSSSLPFEHSEVEPGSTSVFIGHKAAG
ncbi:MAG: class I SAM-dependent methyltransferase [Anaerolineales bacterium]|nr:MAG: class I SAM-dependent methyltransferase [Anaerolineales bacterium]